MCVKIGRLVHVRLDLATRVRKIPIWSIDATSVLKKGMAEVDAVKLRAPRALDTRKERQRKKAVLLAGSPGNDIMPFGALPSLDLPKCQEP